MPSSSRVQAAAPAATLDKIDWRNLVRAIEANSVIPVVGRELLVVDDEGTPTRHDQAVARRLAARLLAPTRDATPGNGAPIELEEVALAYLKDHPGDWPTVCTELEEVMDDYKPPVPAALQKLAAMPFRLFLTTTFDDLLVRALEGSAVKVYELGAQRSISEAIPLPPQIPAGQRAVYHLLGRLGQPGDFPLTEEDTLELIHKLEVKLETRSLEVAGLRAHLEGSQLLVLGCGYPDWLLRFFVRTLRLDRYRDKPERRARVADATAAMQTPLALFFGRYNVPVFAGDLTVFIDTLHEKLRPKGPAAAAAPAAAPAASTPVILAHGPGEREMAQRIQERLADLGVAAARREWSPGPPVAPPALEGCDVYAAFLSEAALRDIAEVALRDEWRAVQDRQESQEAGPFGTLMLTLDAEARRRPNRPESSDWPAWPRATVKHAPADDQIVETIARCVFDAGHLPRPDTRVQLHVVASEADSTPLEQLEKQLAALRFIEVSDHREALPGEDAGAWRARLQRASVIAILVTKDVLDAGKDPERRDEPGAVELALDRHRAGEALVIPVLATSLFGWRESFGADGGPPLSPVPRRGEFLDESPNQDVAWSEAARELAFRIQLRSLQERRRGRKEAR